MKNTTTPQTQKQPAHKSKAKQKRENATQNYTNLAIILKNRERCPRHNCKKVQQRKIRYKTNNRLGLERISKSYHGNKKVTKW